MNSHTHTHTHTSSAFIQMNGTGHTGRERKVHLCFQMRLIKLLVISSTKLTWHWCQCICTAFLPHVVHQACPTLSYKTTFTLRALQHCLSLTYPVLSSSHSSLCTSKSSTSLFSSTIIALMLRLQLYCLPWSHSEHS